ncbi:hypothetical protein [Burkholderia stagnalis]|uniref:Morphogenetic protein n=1 Tax=Burkholderia stagnalis TaxID=1503054 RepID=A0ABX9YUT2_9BURK|nr:hypothetical protein [Burkholderia stagnalis]RQQ64397.1 hypothetical protein DF158_06225 [Burkholderia stagnalis]RQR03789.1 hypothetical protein DF025_31630 [Burkholderia stagnalis]RQR12584.1 hypothetical protein DF026_32505 [Burkholderia stagnalis]RQR15276.1 hypothetical protein DF021_06225 [Burkholderia stagnalis]RQY96467.1 hypothetical protein DF017_07405 [Burkholderia stagnalis]
MKERPILFSGPMVRAILEGRKTQTRRVLSPPNGYRWLDLNVGTMVNDGGHKKHITDLPQRHGVAGDRLWVRETHEVRRIGTETFEDGRPTRHYAGVAYQADNSRAEVDIDLNTFQALDAKESRGWTPSIHMPRWASRITLEITGVRAERLQSISEADARNEGVTIADHHMRCHGAGAFRPPSIRAFHDLWDSLNAARGHGWDANPWVWTISFRTL